MKDVLKTCFGKMASASVFMVAIISVVVLIGHASDSGNNSYLSCLDTMHGLKNLASGINLFKLEVFPWMNSRARRQQIFQERCHESVIPDIPAFVKRARYFLEHSNKTFVIANASDISDYITSWADVNELFPLHKNVISKLSNTYDHIKQAFRDGNFFTVHDAEALTINVEIKKRSELQFTHLFSEAIRWLPVDKVAIQNREYLQFIRDYGTHYYSAANFGDAFSQQRYIDVNYLRSHGREEVKRLTKWASEIGHTPGSPTLKGQLDELNSNTRDVLEAKVTEGFQRSRGDNKDDTQIRGDDPVVNRAAIMEAAISPLYTLISDENKADIMKVTAHLWLNSQLKARCRSDWTEFEGRCYKVVTKPMTFVSARYHCMKTYRIPSLMAVAETKFTDVFLRMLVAKAHQTTEKSQYWLDGRKTTDKVWMWRGNDAMKYENWRRKEESNQGCLAAGGSGGWYSEDCYAKRPFVCQSVGSTVDAYTNRACVDTFLGLRCLDPKFPKIKVLQAYYGALNTASCQPTEIDYAHNPDLTGITCQSDKALTTSPVAGYCDGKSRCDLHRTFSNPTRYVSRHFVGFDQCKGPSKYMDVSYICLSNEVLRREEIADELRDGWKSNEE